VQRETVASRYAVGIGEDALSGRKSFKEPPEKEG
jgi:hypothetical protein